jgi:putative ABC transport system permease protein
MRAQRLPTPPRHPLNPRVAGVRLSALFDHYRLRLRRQLPAELLAGAGIAAGVALVFGVLLANSSITGSAPALIRAVQGSARVQLRARSPEGFPEALALRAGRLPGVRYAAFVLRENGELVAAGATGARGTSAQGAGARGASAGGTGASGRTAPVQLVGISAGFVALHNSATASLATGADLIESGGLGVPAPVAQRLRLHAGQTVSLLIGGSRHAVAVHGVYGAETLGPAARAPIAVAGLEAAQALSGHPRRVTEVLIEPQPHADARVARELRALAAGRVSVEAADSELAILDATAGPLGQSTAVFVAIGAMVGILFVVNALLLTLPERRWLVAELHAQGFDVRQIALILLSQALVLGTLASLAGLALGALLAGTLFSQSPVYLAAAFPVASAQSIRPAIALAALAGGIGAAALSGLAPLAVLRSESPLTAAVAGTDHAIQRIGPRAARALAGLGAGLIVLTTVLALAVPRLTILGGILLALAVPCLMPALFAGTLAALKRLGRRLRGSMLALSAIELNATATRSVALIGVAALAVYGSVAIQGARGDLVRGLDRAVVEYLQPAPLWVAANDKFLTVDNFPDDGATAAIRRVAGVSEVRAYAGSLLDVGTHSLWIRGRDPRDAPILQASQLLHGEQARAEALIRRGGWAAVSAGFATERGLRVGSAFTLATPAGQAPLRVAAITTNTGWSPGVLTLALADYRRWWQSRRPTALEVELKPGVDAGAARAAVARALAGRPGLRVQTRAQRVASFQASAREGLRSLSQIATLLLLSAALAVAAVLSASIWQRRGRLAALGTQGFDHLQLWRAVVLESGVAVAVGCADGALLGLYGHALASRWLALSTGFPAPFSLGVADIALALGVVGGCTVLLAGALGYRSARVSPALAFQEQR